MSLDVETSRLGGGGRVPVEHRFLGLDRRSFPYALFVVVVFLVATAVIPRVNDAMSWDDPVEAGDTLALTSNLVFTPATGWNVERGFRDDGQGPPAHTGEAILNGAGVTFDIVPGAFDGSPDQLITQIAKVTRSTGDSSFQVSGRPQTVTTAAGDNGVMVAYSSIRGDGLVTAFVIDGTGLKITAYGPPTQMAAAADEIDHMITSIRSIAVDGRSS